MIKFLMTWFIYYCLVITAMCIDNIFWIPADKKWFLHNTLQPHFWILIVFGKEYIFPKDKFALDFIWNERITHVIKHPYDIIPAIITSLLITFVSRILG